MGQDPGASAEEPPRGPLTSLADIEREHIIRVMAHSQNSVPKAAEILGIPQSLLREKLRNLWE